MEVNSYLKSWQTRSKILDFDLDINQTGNFD